MKLSNHGFRKLIVAALLSAGSTNVFGALKTFNNTLRGNWNNTSSIGNPFVERNGTVTLNGTSTQSISSGVPGGVGETYFNLTINKASGGVTLNDIATITGTATFTSGIVTSTSSDLFIFNDNALTSGANNGSYVNGPVRKTGNEAFTFPVGKSGWYASIAISAPASSTDEFTAE